MCTKCRKKKIVVISSVESLLFPFDMEIFKKEKSVSRKILQGNRNVHLFEKIATDIFLQPVHNAFEMTKHSLSLSFSLDVPRISSRIRIEP